MKTAAIFLIIIFNIFAMGRKTALKQPAQPCVSITEARKVLGEPAALLSNSVGEKTGIKESSCGYTALKPDPEKQVTGSFYVTVKQYPTVAAAHNAYADMFTANSRLTGQEKVAIGEEGYYHTDGTHFYFFAFRRGREVAVLKVNKITRNTSLPGLRKLAEAMAGKKSML